jgi:hypothetical protein
MNNCNFNPMCWRIIMTHYITKSLQLVYNCTCIHIGQGEAPLPLLIFETYNPCKQTKKQPKRVKYHQSKSHWTPRNQNCKKNKPAPPSHQERCFWEFFSHESNLLQHSSIKLATSMLDNSMIMLNQEIEKFIFSLDLKIIDISIS